MKFKLLLILLLIGGRAFSQTCDTVTNLSVTGIAGTTATVTATPPADVSDVTGYQLRVINVTTSASFIVSNSTPSFSVTGLTACTQYIVYVTTLCNSDQAVQVGRYRFTTTGCSTPSYKYTLYNVYGWQVPRLKVDSAFSLPIKDTTSGTTYQDSGQVMIRREDSSFWYRMKGRYMQVARMEDADSLATTQSVLEAYRVSDGSEGYTLSLANDFLDKDSAAVNITGKRVIQVVRTNVLKRQTTGDPALDAYVLTDSTINLGSELSAGEIVFVLYSSNYVGDSSYTAGYGLTLSSNSFSVDSFNISTRAWRQKGLDSMIALFNTPTQFDTTANRYSFSGFASSINSLYHESEGTILNMGGDSLIHIFRLDSTNAHVGINGNIAQRLSYDGGVSWTDYAITYNSAYDDRNIIGGVLDDGRIVLVFRRYSSGTIDVGRIYSDDKGQTWSSYSTITTGFGTDEQAPFGRIFKAGDGVYRMVVYKAFGEAKIYKTVDGDSWVEQASLYSGVSTYEVEPFAAYIGDDKIVALVRDNPSSGNDSTYFVYRSSDNGDTWSYVGRSGMNRNQINVNITAPFITWDSVNNVVIAISTERHQAGGVSTNGKADSAYIYIQSPDDAWANTWTERISTKRPIPSVYIFYGYPQLTRLSSGRYVGMITDGRCATQACSIEYPTFYQFELNYNTTYLNAGLSNNRIQGAPPSFNPITRLYDFKTDDHITGAPNDSLAYWAIDKGFVIATPQSNNANPFAVTNSAGSANYFSVSRTGVVQFNGYTSGGIPFFGANNVLRQAPTKLFWDSTNNRLGIGTATPSATLELGSGGNIKLQDNQAIIYGAGGGTDFFYGNSASHFMAWVTNGTERFRINTNGLVSFGGTSSTFPALKRSGTTLQVRLADDSDYGSIQAGNVTAQTTIFLGSLKWVSGTGSPEGVVVAPVGSFYSRTDGGAGTVWYVKESGASNTGWVAK